MNGISLFDVRVRETLDRYFASPEFKDWLRLRVKWSMQGFEPGYEIRDRERFTETVARRIRQKARCPVCLMGHRIWRARLPWAQCRWHAELIVTEFLKDDRIKFGDPRFDWTDGAELADTDMSYWERCR
jgi:hypothetical protein